MSTPTERDGMLHLRDYVQVLRRSALTVIVFTAIGAAAAFLVTQLEPSIYEAGVELVVDQNEAASVIGQSFTPIKHWDSTFLETQIRVIQSDALISRSVDLMREWEMDGVRESTPDAPGDDGMPSAIELLTQAMQRTEGLADFTRGRDRRALISEIRRGLSISFVSRTRILRIQTQSESPAFCAASANMVAQAYADYITTRFASSTERMFLMLKKQADETSRNIRKTATALLELKKIAEVASMQGGDTAEGELDGKQVEMIKRRLGLSDPEIVAVQNELEQVVRNINALAGRYKPKHPEMLALLSQRDFLESKVRKKLDAAYAQWERTHAEEQTAVEYAMLEQDLEATRRLHELLVGKMKEIDFSRDTPNASVQILKTARMPSRPAYPNKVVNIALGSASGLMAGLLLAFALAYRRSSLISLATATAELPAQLLGSLPHVPDKELPDILRGQSDYASPSTEAFNTMRTVLESLLAGTRVRPGLNDALRNVVLITSPDRGDGKSTISTALAQSLVKLGKRVLLVDVDLRRGKLHETLDVSDTDGLSDLLRGADDVSGREITKNLTFLPRGTSTANPSELLASPAMLAFAEEAGRNFDVVLLDSPPLLPVTDASLVARYAAVKIIVARSQRTHLAACRHAASILENLGYSIDGIILNDVKDVERSYYGYYRSDYYQGYAGDGADRS